MSDPLIDISHESLIRQWDMLRGWVDKEAESRAIYLRLANAATLYRDKGEGLYRNPALDLALAWRDKVKPNKVWAERYHPEFDSTMSYLDKSKRRQRYRLGSYAVLGVFGFALLLTPFVLEANARRLNAVQAQSLIAEQKSVEAEAARTLAVAALKEGEKQRGFAEA